MAAPRSYCGRCVLRYRHLLVRLDRIPSRCSLDCSYTFRSFDWFWPIEHLPPGAQLSRRCLSHGTLYTHITNHECITDCTKQFAASAIAANTFLRSLCGAVFPLFARQMFQGMGIQWAATLLGIIAVLLVPVPVWFYFKGGKIREKSAYAPTKPPGSEE